MLGSNNSHKNGTKSILVEKMFLRFDKSSFLLILSNKKNVIFEVEGDWTASGNFFQVSQFSKKNW